MGSEMCIRDSANGRFFGTAVGTADLQTDPALMAHVADEAGMVVGEYQFKWAALHPKPHEYAFAAADQLVAWAQSRGLQVRGHTLLWNQSNPAWLAQACATPAAAAATLSSHIATVCGHFRDRLVHWDVTNEVLSGATERADGLRDSPWARALGTNLLDLAFAATAAADPAALRVMNEDQIEYTWDKHTRKRERLLAALAGMRARGVPVQALGMQAHLIAGVKEFAPRVIRDFVASVRALGVEVLVTELDVADHRLPANVALRDAEVAAHARAYLDAVLDGGGVLGVLTWGLSDRRSWLNQQHARADGLAQRALPLDQDLRPKPLHTAIAEALRTAPPR